MENNIRIYYNDQCIFIASNANELIDHYRLSNAWTIRNAAHRDLKALFLLFTNTSFSHLVLEGDMQSTFELFQEGFKIIQAGGGVVWNEKDELLMIHRLGKWDLPKGKLDAGERMEQCALREVQEETGLKNVTLQSFLKSSFHIYSFKKEWILKQTDWYKMDASSQHLIPQTEEGITEATWVTKNEINEKLNNSYPNIIFLLNNVL